MHRRWFQILKPWYQHESSRTPDDQMITRIMVLSAEWRLKKSTLHVSEVIRFLYNKMTRIAAAGVEEFVAENVAEILHASARPHHQKSIQQGLCRRLHLYGVMIQQA